MQKNSVVAKEADVSDSDLVRRIAAKDRRAMELLFTRHRIRVYRFALRLTDNPASAEDVTSDVFLDVWRKPPQFEGRAELSTYLLAIVRNKAMSALRRRRTEPLDEATAAEIPDSADDAETMLHKQAQASRLQQSLAQLSPSHREIVDLVYYHGKSIADVVAITGAPPNTVKTRMHYARKHLAKLLHGYGLDQAA